MMEVFQLTPDEMIWPLGIQGGGGPTYSCGFGTYPRTVTVDPYPGYAHNFELVKKLAADCEKSFPLSESRVGIWTLSHDFIEHMNGITYEDSIYRREDDTEWNEEYSSYDDSEKKVSMYGQAITIVLAGKRIPIMPSMTRYLVSHEYGHAVFNYVARRFGYKDHEKGKLEEKYMEIRGITNYAKKYRGGHWHESPGEIVANDFRLLFMNQEREFWPHECPVASWDSPIGDWWREACKISGVGSDKTHLPSSRSLG
jgi:hypothetical protein